MYLSASPVFLANAGIHPPDWLISGVLSSLRLQETCLVVRDM